MSDIWAERKRPARLERRFEFDNYEQTREFLDKAAELAESEDYYPDMNFAQTRVSMTLYPKVEGDEISDEMYQYTKRIDEIAVTALSS